MKKPYRFWIKERHNPQMSRPYFAVLGRLSETAAKRHTRPIYGANVLHSFETEEDYKARIRELMERGECVL
jgi:hypothetical protein